MARTVDSQDIDFCVTVGNQRGRAAQPDGRRGQIVLEFPAPRHWGDYLAERFIKKNPLPHRFGAIYFYCRARTADGEPPAWAEVLSHTTTMAPESAELDAQAEVTIEAMRETNALVSQRQQEVASLGTRERALQEQVASAEATLATIRAEIQAHRTLLAQERDRCTREIKFGEERLQRESAALDEMLRNRRAVAAAEEARIQASLEATTMAAMKGLESISNLCKAQVDERQSHLEEISKGLEAEISAARLISERRQGMQIALARTQQAHLEFEEKKLDQLDSLVPMPEGQRPETAGDRLKNVAAEKIKEIEPMAVFNGIMGFFMRKAEQPTE